MDEAPKTFFDSEFLKTLERLHLVAKKLFPSGWKGEHPSPRRGFSLEFSDYRRYQTGDDLRYVDWNVYRRLDRLFLKLFTAEEEMNIYLLLDASRSMAEGNPQKMEYVKRVAAALGYIGLRNLDRVGGATFSSDVRSVLPIGRGKKQILALFDFLRALSCEGETDLESSVKSFSLLFPRPGLLVLLSDLFDPHGYRAGIEALLRQYEVLVVHVVDRAETLAEPRGDVSLLDVESARERRLFLDDGLVGLFRKELGRYFEELESFCFNHSMNYLRTTTATPFEDFVLLTVRRGRNLKL
jgi:uncharacterized protein (DUF58 family)